MTAGKRIGSSRAGRWAIGPAVLLLTLAFALPAQAAYVKAAGTKITYRAGFGEANALTVTYSASADEYRFQEAGVVPGNDWSLIAVTTSGICKEISLFPGTAIACPAAGVRRFKIDLWDLDDRLKLDLAAPISGTLVKGGAGNDSLLGSRAGVGHGDILNGGAGDDTLVGFSGTDRLIGSSGNDRLDSLDAGDSEVEKASCGTGTDKYVGNTGSVADRSSSCESSWDLSSDPY